MVEYNVIGRGCPVGTFPQVPRNRDVPASRRQTWITPTFSYFLGVAPPIRCAN